MRFWFMVGGSVDLRSMVGWLGRCIGRSRGMVGRLSRNVGRGWGMVSRFGSRGMISRFRSRSVVSRFRSRGVISRFGSRGVIGWSMDHRSMMNNWCLIRGRFVIYRWWRGMVWFWGFIRCRCMVGFGRMVGCWGVVWSRSVIRLWSMVGDVGRGVNTYNRFFYTTIAMDRLGRGSWLAGYMSMVSIVGLVDRHMD